MNSLLKTVFVPLFILLAGCDDNQFTDVIGDHWIKDPEVCLQDTTPVSFKKVAYWSPDDSDNLELVNFSSLTHVNYASISFNSDATLNIPEDIEPLEDLVLLAHAQSVKVAISLGDTDDTIFNSIAADKALTKTLVINISDFIEEYELDGIDIHWQSVDSDDESDRLKYLLKKLSAELKEQNKFLSMTVPPGENEKLANKLSTENFQYVDFMNVLAFDSTNKDSLHSSMQDAMDAINYWTQRCVVKNKLVLGVPFYSRGSAVRSYDHLIRDDINYACEDENERRNYNGIPTIIKKTNYALLNAGGVMMKSLEQDVYMRNNDKKDFSEYSLLNVINETALDNKVSVCQ